MSMTNCVNCGSAKDADASVCPFCGTSYYDLTHIDLSGKKPCVLKLKLPGSDSVFTMKAYPGIANLTFRPVTCDITSLQDSTPRYIHQYDEITCDLQFRGFN